MYKSEILNNFEEYRSKFDILDDLSYIESFYNSKGRYYHNMNHLDDVLCCLEDYNKSNLFNETEYQILVMTAIYHDIIYNPKAKDNEEKSAQFINDCSCSEDIKRQVYNLILFTKYQRAPKNDLEEIFMSCDMNVFDKSFTEQLQFEKNIQKEYSWVPLDVYVKNRIKVLSHIREISDPLNIGDGIKTNKLIEYLENKKWNIGIYAGSFYPFHIGHYDILKQAENIFDKVIILQSNNGPKKTNFVWDQSVDEYVGPMNKIFEKYEVHTLSGLITTELEKFKHLGNVTLIRGLRNGSDLLYEQNYIQTLRDIDQNINVAYFLTKPENAHVSSSMIRELIKIDYTKAIKYLPRD